MDDNWGYPYFRKLPLICDLALCFPWWFFHSSPIFFSEKVWHLERGAGGEGIGQGAVGWNFLGVIVGDAT